MTEQREIETKYEVTDDTVVPDLTAAPAVASTSTDAVFSLAAVYYDTELLDLAANRITLRRRTGGKDDGWHLKVPDGTDRRELGAPLGEGTNVPDELIERVQVFVRQRALSPIAIIRNERHTTYCHDADGRLLGEFVDDHVTSVSLLPGGTEKSWREWEFEIPDSDAARAAAIEVDRVLRDAGARTPDSASKLARAIDADPVGGGVALPRKPARATAGQLLTAALAAYRDRLVAQDPRVRARGADSVHQMRVATRQLRSVLTEYSGYFAGPARAALSSELKVLASILGTVRDAEVLADRFTTYDAEKELGGAGLTLAQHQRDIEATGWVAIEQALSSSRYFLMLDAIDAFIAAPPLAEQADKLAVKSLAPALHKRIRRFAIDSSNQLAAPSTTDDDVHDIRKHAKRLRYAAAVVDPVVRGDLRIQIKALAAVQQRLGEFQDATIARDAIAELAGQTTDPAVAFRLGRLDATEESSAAVARADLPKLLRKLR